METSRTMNSLFTSASSYVLRNLNSRALDLGLTKFNSQGTLSTLIGGDAGEEDRRERLAHLETIERFFVDHGFTSDLLDHSFLPIVDAFQHCRDAPPKRATGGLSSLVRSFTHSLILHPPSLGVSASPSAANLSAAVTCTTLTVASPRSVEDVGGDDVDDDAGQHQCLAAADAAPQITPIRPSASTDSFHALPGSAFQPVEHGAVGGLRSASTPSVRESATGGIVVGGEGDGGQQPGCDDSAKKLEGSSRQSSPVRLSRPGSTMPRITELDCTEIKKFSWSLDSSDELHTYAVSRTLGPIVISFNRRLSVVEVRTKLGFRKFAGRFCEESVALIAQRFLKTYLEILLEEGVPVWDLIPPVLESPSQTPFRDVEGCQDYPFLDGDGDISGRSSPVRQSDQEEAGSPRRGASINDDGSPLMRRVTDGAKPDHFFEFAVSPMDAQSCDSKAVLQSLLEIREYESPKEVLVDVCDFCNLSDGELSRIFGTPAAEFVEFKAPGESFKQMNLLEENFPFPSRKSRTRTCDDDQMKFRLDGERAEEAILQRLRELFETERSHLRRLQMLELYRTELLKMRARDPILAMTDYVINTCFPDVSALIDATKQLLELFPNFEKLPSTHGAKQDFCKKALDQFIRHVENVKPFLVKYLPKYKTSQERIAPYSNSSTPEGKAMSPIWTKLETLSSKTLNAIDDIGSFTYAAIQRIYQYEALLIGTVEAIAPTYSLHPLLIRAHQQVQGLVAAMTQAEDEFNQKTLLLRLSHYLKRADEVATATHQYLMDWDKLNDNRSGGTEKAFFLLSDLLLVLAKTSGGREKGFWSLERTISLDQLEVVKSPAVSPSNGKASHIRLIIGEGISREVIDYDILLPQEIDSSQRAAEMLGQMRHAIFCYRAANSYKSPSAPVGPMKCFVKKLSGSETSVYFRILDTKTLHHSKATSNLAICLTKNNLGGEAWSTLAELAKTHECVGIVDRNFEAGSSIWMMKAKPDSELVGPSLGPISLQCQELSNHETVSDAVCLAALVYLHREFHPTCPAALAEREAVLTSFLVKARSPRRRNLLANFLKPRHRRKTSVSTIATVRSFDAERLRWAQNEELEGRTSVEAAQANAQIRREAAPVDAKGKPPIGNGNRLKGGLRPWFSFGKNSKTKLMEQIEMVEGSGQVPYQSSNSSGNKPNFARKQPSPSDEKVLSYVKKLRSLILPSNVASTILNSEEINPMTLHNALKDQNLLEPSDSLFNILVRHLEKMSNMELRRDEWSNIVSAFATALFEAASEKAVAAIETLARHAQAVQTGHFERLGGRDASVSSLATENFSLYQTPNSASDENIDQPQRHQRSYRNRSDSADGDGNLIGAVCQALAPSESILPPDELKRVADDDTKVFRVNDRLESATTVYDSNEVE